MGKNMRHALEFIRRCSGWHSFAKDRATTDAIRQLEKRDLVETNRHRQFRLMSD